MSSREIADLTGKDHKHVLADIRVMIETLKIDSAEFSAQYKDSTGRSLPCFNLPKDLTFTLVLGYDVRRRYAVTRRWLELENDCALPLADVRELQQLSRSQIGADLRRLAKGERCHK